MTDKIRVGIVGATVTQGGSGWGANAHVPALKALPHYELKAVCTSHEDTAKASAAAFGAERAFHRFSDMAADPDVDLIVVCVRVPGHRDLVMAGLQAGKAVLCEWPLGANLAEAQEMAGLASQRSAEDGRRSAGAQRPDDSVRARPRPGWLHRRSAHGEPEHRRPRPSCSGAPAASGRACAPTAPTR